MENRQWTQRPNRPDEVVNAADGETIGRFDSVADARLATAAPEMARAMVEMLDILGAIREGSYTVDSFTNQGMRSALAAAGIELPQ